MFVLRTSFHACQRISDHKSSNKVSRLKFLIVLKKSQTNWSIITYHFLNSILTQKPIDPILRKGQHLYQSQIFILQGLIMLLNSLKFKNRDRHLMFFCWHMQSQGFNHRWIQRWNLKFIHQMLRIKWCFIDIDLLMDFKLVQEVKSFKEV